MHDIASLLLFLRKNVVLFLGNFIQNLFLNNLKLVYVVFKQFDNQQFSNF